MLTISIIRSSMTPLVGWTCLTPTDSLSLPLLLPHWCRFTWKCRILVLPVVMEAALRPLSARPNLSHVHMQWICELPPVIMVQLHNEVSVSMLEPCDLLVSGLAAPPCRCLTLRWIRYLLQPCTTSVKDRKRKIWAPLVDALGPTQWCDDHIMAIANRPLKVWNQRRRGRANRSTEGKREEREREGGLMDWWISGDKTGAEPVLYLENSRSFSLLSY